MPLRVPPIDDRPYEALLRELLDRVPAHTPEWRNPREGDPGRMLLELMAHLAHDAGQRANSVSEQQRLAFLSLLGEPLRPARAATGLVAVTQLDEAARHTLHLTAGARVGAKVAFETLDELSVPPVQAEVWIKKVHTPTQEEEEALADYLRDLAGAAQVEARGAERARLSSALRVPALRVPYRATPLFLDGRAEDLDLVADTVDGRLWIALLAPPRTTVEQARAALVGPDGTRLAINVGFVPGDRRADAADTWLFEEVSDDRPYPVSWTCTVGGGRPAEARTRRLEVVADHTAGLTRAGVVRLLLPAAAELGAPEDDVTVTVLAGLGDRPPRLDDPDRARRLVAWLCLEPSEPLSRLPVAWVGLNAVRIDQRERQRRVVLGVSDGGSDQEFRLPFPSVEPDTLVIEVEEPGRGYVPWTRVEQLGAAGRDDRVYALDAEAGRVRFGDGLRGKVPPAARRVRLGAGRAGGGAVGNLDAGTLREISARDLSGAAVGAPLGVVQPIATAGGADAETVGEAERRLPARLRHGDRAIGVEDFRALALEAPGVRPGRVEVLPGFRPRTRMSGMPGVVSVMVLPRRAEPAPPNPRIDRRSVEAVFAWLDPRRLAGTELYVIGCEYVQLGVAISIQIRDDHGRAATLAAVRRALFSALWPLPPGGAHGQGWPLGRAVRDRELLVAAARVPGVDEVRDLAIYHGSGARWPAVRRGADGAAELRLEPWQLPELVRVDVVVDADLPSILELDEHHAGDARSRTIAIPVIPEVC